MKDEWNIEIFAMSGINMARPTIINGIMKRIIPIIGTLFGWCCIVILE